MGSFTLDGRQPGQLTKMFLILLASTRLNTERRTTRRSSTTSSPRLSPTRRPRTMTSWPAPPSTTTPGYLWIPLDFPPTTLAVRENHHGSVAVILPIGVRQKVIPWQSLQTSITGSRPSTINIPRDLKLRLSIGGPGTVRCAVMDGEKAPSAIVIPYRGQDRGHFPLACCTIWRLHDLAVVSCSFN